MGRKKRTRTTLSKRYCCISQYLLKIEQIEKKYISFSSLPRYPLHSKWPENFQTIRKQYLSKWKGSFIYTGLKIVYSPVRSCMCPEYLKRNIKKVLFFISLQSCFSSRFKLQNKKTKQQKLMQHFY